MRVAGRPLKSSTIDPQTTDAIISLLRAALTPKRRYAKSTSSNWTSYPRLPNRREIVSKKLCDDSVKYIAQSLKPWKGTTIVDINPGTCLWSSSLHQFLQPKRHILLEPDAAYDPFIKPLLERPGSRYQHISIAGVREESYFDAWSDLLKNGNVLGDRTSLETDDPRLRELDTSLLITGNLWRFPSISKSLTKYAANIISQTCWAAMSNEIFHNAGRVRMLWWLPEEQLSHVLASNSRRRTSFSVGLELGASARHIVGCTPLQKLGSKARNASPRGKFLEDLLEREVRARMREQKITTRNDRSNILAMFGTYNEAEKGRTKLRGGFPNPLKTSCTTLDDLAALIEQHEHRRRRAFDSAARLRNTEWPESNSTYRWSAQRASVWPQAIREVFDRNTYEYDKRWGFIFEVAVSVDLVVDLIHLEAEWQALSRLPESNKEQLAELKKRLEEADVSWTTWTTPRLRRTDLQHIRALATHIQLYYAQPQPISYDQREFEPLRAQREDFWPAGNMALLDVIPRDIDMSIQGLASAREGAYACRQLIRHMFMSRYGTIAEALSGLAPNAREDLLPQLEELADPIKGGRLDPSKVGVQSVHADTYRKLAAIYKEWPFKPEVGYMSLPAQAGIVSPLEDDMTASDSSQVDEDVVLAEETAEPVAQNTAPLPQGS